MAIINFCRSSLVKRALVLVLIFTSCCVYVKAGLHSGKIPRISLECKNESMPAVLKKVEQLSNYKILFTYNEIQNYKVTVSFRNKLLNQAIEEIIAPFPLAYKIKNNSFISIYAISKDSKRRIVGMVIDKDGNPLSLALVSFPDYGIGEMTDGNGNYSLSGVPPGKANIHIRYMGKVEIDTILNVQKDLHINFVMKDVNFHLKDVIVTAQENKGGHATSSNISRMAMDHMQATSLNDIMSLIPGGLSTNPTLNTSAQLNIRNISSNSDDQNMNALGTAIIQDGAPISNNANLQSLNPTVVGATTSLAGGASPTGGTDVRQISVDNIESVEVIRGIPSVEYGDLTSGAVIIHSKAGLEPLRINGKVNSNVYEFSANKGLSLGENKGDLNVGLDYAYNIDDPIESYVFYQRASGKILYSNAYFQNRLRNNISFDFFYGHDGRKRNPDDVTTETSSSGKDLGFTLNANGILNFKKLWLTNIRYVASFSYTSKKSYFEQLYTNANAPYTMTTTDGAVLSNTAGDHIYAADGSEITHFGDADAKNYAVYLPSSYFGRYDIDGKEINFFSKVSANFFKKFGNTLYNRILLGADFKTDGNNGKGKTFDPTTPPYRNLSASNATFRPRAYKDIPFVSQLGFFGEENLKWRLGIREFNIQAGLRYDKVSVVKSIITPRINASFDLLPNIFSIRGGYGVTAKAPTALYLHPEPAYFEYINYNGLTDESIPESERLFITTTKVYDSLNKYLEIAKNHKAEIGFDLMIKQARLAVTAFFERMDNGYSLSETVNSFKPFIFNEYSLNSDNKLELSSTNSVLSSFATPNNNRVLHSKGLEFDLNLGRFDPIRTSFSVNGAWIRSKNYDKGYTFYDESGSAASDRKDVALYEQGMTKHITDRLSTVLRATHNIPSIGLAVTLTMQTIWREADWYNMGNDSIPVGYISKTDGSISLFSAGQYTTRQQLKDAGKDYLLRTVNSSYYIKESYNPLFCFNIYVTKEIGKYMRASFFANNMFRNYPLATSKRNPGTKVVRNNNYFFGCELSLLF